MPQGIGKLRDKARAKFPRLSSFFERYHATLSALGILALLSVVGYIGYSQHHTESTITHVQGDVNVIKQQSSCAPKLNGEPKRPKRCRESFHTIIHKILTPLEACEFLERGAPLIRIGGKPIPRVECVHPHSESSVFSPRQPKHRAGQQSDDSGQSVTRGSGPTAPGGNTGTGGGESKSGKQDGSGGHHASGSEPAPNPAPSPAPEGPGASGGAGHSEESNANGQSEETPADENSNSPKLLPGAVKPVESIVCNSVAGNVVCTKE